MIDAFLFGKFETYIIITHINLMIMKMRDDMENNHSEHGKHSEHVEMAEHKNMEHEEHKEHKKHDEHSVHMDHAGESHHEMMIKDYRKRFAISMLLTIPILMLDPTLQEFFGLKFLPIVWKPTIFVLSSLIYLYGGKPFLLGFIDEISKRKPGMMVLISVAISVAYAYSIMILVYPIGEPFFWELATLIDIMLLGHWIEMKAILGASRALEKMVKLLPSKATKVLEDGSLIEVSVEELKPGDIVLIRPGERIPVDGVVIDGKSNVDESILTGESLPQSKEKGSKVIAGSINMDGSLQVKVMKTGKETYVSQVIELVKEVQEARSRTQDLADKAAFYLTLIAIFGGVFTLISWILLGGELNFAMERAVTVMVIACPHALGLAIPLAVAVSTSLAAKKGFLIRERDAFERTRLIDTIVFDKTGTLTKGEFGVTDVVPLADMKEEEVLQLAASVEKMSEHPIAKAIVRHATNKGLKLLEADNFTAMPGIGVKAKVGDKEVALVSPNYMKEKGFTDYIEKLPEKITSNKTVIYVMVDEKPVGAIALGDIIREESYEAVKKLKEMGLKVIMLTGDNKNVASYVSKELGIDEYFAELLPHQKVEAIRELQQRGLKVAMVGDGINDAPALIQADVGIAIGAGTDIAIESADIILVRNDPRDIVDVIRLSRKSYRKMIENLIWATGYNSFAIPLAAGILVNYGIILTPAIGAALMSLSTVIVAINAKLLKL